MKLRSKKPISQYDCDEMDEYTDGYVQYVMEALAKARENCPDPVVIGEDGFGEFRTEGRSVSVWVLPEAFEDLVVNE